MQGSRGGVDDMEMELLYHRLIQLTYLDVVVSIDTIPFTCMCNIIIQSAKALKQQETEAKVLYNITMCESWGRHRKKDL